MLDKIANSLKEFATAGGSSKPFDATQFGDPLAEKIRWSPLAQGGSSIRLRKLQERRGDIVFAPTFTSLSLFSLISLTITAVLVWAAVDMIKKPELFEVSSLIIPAILLLFLFASLAFIYSQLLPIVFSKEVGSFYKGGRDRVGVLSNCLLEEIAAIQIVGELVRSTVDGRGSYRSYEMNLVLTDGLRVNVIDQPNRKKVLKDAATLAKYLGVPVWDGTMKKSRAADDVDVVVQGKMDFINTLMKR